MKRIIKRIGLVICFIFIITGCGSMASSKDINNYISENYPDDSIQIIKIDDVDDVHNTCYDEDDDIVDENKHPGHIYTLYSKKTNIKFTIKDIYVSSSAGICYYTLSDDYDSIFKETCLNKYGDKKFRLDNQKDYFEADYDSFNSKEELANSIYGLSQACNKNNVNINKFNLMIYTNNLNRVNVSFDEDTTKEDIMKDLENIN